MAEQVYLDFGLTIPKLSVQGTISSSKDLLELAPTKKNCGLFVRISFSMDDHENQQRYKPGRDFEQVKKEPLLDINLTDSTELWLIQLPLNQLTPGDFEGRELSLKLHRDRNLGTFESSSGKSYDVVNVGTNPNATVFLPSGSVGKIARRVTFVRYPDPKELAKPRGLSAFALSNQTPINTGYARKTKSKYSTPTKSDVSKITHSASHETQESAPKLGQGNAASSSHKKRRGQ